MKKLILSLTLAALLMTALAVPAFAVDITGETTGSTTLTYGVAEAFIVTIPADFNLSTTESSYAVSASGVVIPNSNRLTVTMSSAQFNDADKYRVAYQGSFIKYTVKLGDTPLTANGQTVLTVNAGNASGSSTLKFSTTSENIKAATKAGDHTDTLTFTVAVEPVT